MTHRLRSPIPQARVDPLHESPGVIVLAELPMEDSALLVKALRFIFRSYTDVDVRLDQTKIRLSEEGHTIRLIDYDTQKKETSSWRWKGIL